MSKFKCINKECKNFDKLVEVDDARWGMHWKGVYPSKESIAKDKECKVCGSEMTRNTEFIDKNKAPAFLRFGSMSDSEKKKVLKKRAADEYKKSGGHEKKFLKQREAINKFKGN